MNAAMLLQKVGRYGAVGLVAAAVHAGILLLLSQWISLSLANPIAFLAASLPKFRVSSRSTTPAPGCCACL